MKCIVPLAGPDLHAETEGFRPLVKVDGIPLLEAALETRAWRSALGPPDYIFVVRQVPALHELTAYLGTTWPGCRIVTLSHPTGGALFSVLAATALVPPGEPLVVDLADMLFTEGPPDPEGAFPLGFSMVVPVFTSRDTCYSYLTIEQGRVTGAQEKRPVSDTASAGVYIFRNVQTFLRAASHSIDHRETLAWNGALFICPTINGVIAAGHEVQALHIGDCRPIGKAFHGNAPP